MLELRNTLLKDMREDLLAELRMLRERLDGKVGNDGSSHCVQGLVDQTDGVNMDVEGNQARIVGDGMSLLMEQNKESDGESSLEQ